VSTIDQVALETEGADEELAEQSMLPATDDDTEADNGIDDENLNVDHRNMKIDDDVDDANLNANHDDSPLCFQSINEIHRMAGFALHALVAEELHVVSSDEMTSFAKAESSPSYRKVIMDEMTSIEENVTWSLVDLPPSCK
jgi:hypothetical protein